ncbi:MAG: AmmeMemoRadiSam system radical SAM enzyme [Syntrophomonadaceae bacterium]|nr:AmmeMemoRadiSam system radical SAM enzyme [Syntrophomonadaceae bacterium]
MEQDDIGLLREAMFYDVDNDKRIECRLCPHHCQLKADQLGLCRVRRNDGGVLHTLNYGEVTALALDPIEKKPLYHFYPGTMILSAGTFGCNLSCSFCQNHHIAHEINNGRTILPETMVNICHQAKIEGSVGLAFTYNEPSIWFEYIYDTAKLLKDADMKVVLITNGYIELKPLEKLLPLIDAMNIDLKAFNDHFYKKNCQARIEPVKKVIEKASSHTHVEITTLIITGENDREKEINELTKWLASINPDIPLHLSRYYPAYKFVNEPTPIKTMEIAYDTARQHLNFVYLGNLHGIENNTYCLDCGALLVKRNAYNIKIIDLKGNNCAKCGKDIDYIVN